MANARNEGQSSLGSGSGFVEAKGHHPDSVSFFGHRQPRNEPDLQSFRMFFVMKEHWKWNKA